MVLVSQIKPVRYVADDNLGACVRVQLVMGRISIGNILGEEVWTNSFAYVVIVGSHFRQQSIASDGLGRVLRQLLHAQRVGKRAGCPLSQDPEQRVRCIRQTE